MDRRHGFRIVQSALRLLLYRVKRRRRRIKTTLTKGINPTSNLENPKTTATKTNYDKSASSYFGCEGSGPGSGLTPGTHASSPERKSRSRQPRTLAEAVSVALEMVEGPWWWSGADGNPLADEEEGIGSTTTIAAAASIRFRGACGEREPE